jgi:hypothetical protein
MLVIAASWARRLDGCFTQPRRRFVRRLGRLPLRFAQLLLACIELDPADRPNLHEVRRALNTISG